MTSCRPLKKAIAASLIQLAILFLTFSASAQSTVPQVDAKNPEMENLVQQILEKVGSVEERKFDINIDTTLPGIPVGDSFVSLDVPLHEDISTSVGSTSVGEAASQQPNFEIRGAGTLIHGEASISRNQGKIHVHAGLSFKTAEGAPSFVTLFAAVDKFPRLEVRVHSLQFKTALTEEKKAASKVMPLGEVIQGNCRADILVGSVNKGLISEKKAWKPLEFCSFDANYNQDRSKYDVKMRFKTY